MVHAHGAARPEEHGHGERALGIALGLNAVFLVFEVVVGWWSNSLALMSDAGHMLTDVGALTVALVSQRLAHRSGGPEYTYGLHRFPVLGGLINATALVVVVVLIISEAIERFAQPVEIDALPVLWMGILGFLVNAGSAVVLARSHDHSVNVRGAMLHLLADVLGSVAATVSAIVIMTSGWTAIDPVLSLLIAVFILLGSVPLLRETFRVILERAPFDLPVGEVEKALGEHPSVDEVLDLHVWEVGPDQVVVTAILSAPTNLGLVEADQVTDELRGRLEALGIKHATFEWRHPSSPRPSPCEFEHWHEHD